MRITKAKAKAYQDAVRKLVLKERQCKTICVECADRADCKPYQFYLTAKI